MHAHATRSPLRFAAVLAAVLVANASPSAQALIVGPYAGCTSVVTPGQSVQAAVAAAAANAVVCVEGHPLGVPYAEAANVFIGPGKDGLELRGVSVMGLLGLPLLPAIRSGAAGCTIAVRAPDVKLVDLVSVGNPALVTDGVCFLKGSDGGRATRVLANDHKEYGFLVSESPDVRLERVRAEDNQLVGVHVVTSDRVTVSDRSVVEDNGRGGTNEWDSAGVRVHASDEFALMDSTVQRNGKAPAGLAGGVGVYITSASVDARILRNKILGNHDDGINLEHTTPQPPKYCNDNDDFPQGTLVHDNEIAKNHHEGIHVYSGSKTLIWDNNIHHNQLSGVVFETDTGLGNRLLENEIWANGQGGGGPLFASGVVLRSPNVHTIEKNNIHDNPQDGLLVERVVCNPGPVRENGAVEHEVTQNTLEGNGRHGVFGRDAQKVKVVDNPAIRKNKQDGVHLEDGAHEWRIQHNTIDQNQDDGIELQDTDKHLINQGNTITKNKGYGIWLNPSDKDTIERNTIKDNTLDGLRLEPTSAGSVVMVNRVEGNLDWQIELETGAAGNTIWDNSFIGTKTGKSSNAPFTNSFFRVLGVCAVGNYWSDHLDPPNPAPCDPWRVPTKWVDIPNVEEIDRGPWVDPPA